MDGLLWRLRLVVIAVEWQQTLASPHRVQMSSKQPYKWSLAYNNFTTGRPAALIL